MNTYNNNKYADNAEHHLFFEVIWTSLYIYKLYSQII